METNYKAHLVVIEDDLDVQDLITAFLRPKGYQLSIFSDAESALEKARQDLKCDVVITDFNLPGIDGLELMAELKNIWMETPIILMTGTRSSDMAVEAIEKGAYDFLVKPLHFPQLLVSVERALHLTKLSENFDTLKGMVREQDRQPIMKGIIGKSPAFISALDVAKRVAKSNANIFIAGESGTGKEVVARFIHSESKRNKGPFIAINCSAIPENLLESELFGHAKGAFTGAIDKKLGLFEEATNGTLFLDEIGDLSLPLQAKILRVLQEKKIKRVGENKPRDVNARVISATHKNLVEEINAGRFREDLFFRLNVIPVQLPPLRERKEDILPLAEHFIKKFASLNESPARRLSKDAIQYLLSQSWRGNVRELENAIERAVVLCATDTIHLTELNSAPTGLIDTAVTPTQDEGDFFVKLNGSLLPLQEVMQKYIEFAVAKNGGAKDKTARELGIDRKTLYKRISSAESSTQPTAH